MTTAIVILAAGQGSRFGAIKQLARIKQQALINRQLAFYLQFNLPLILVLGAYYAQIVKEIEPESLSKITVLKNLNWQQGMGNSIAFAMNKVNEEPQISHALITLLDQACLTFDDIKRLLNKSKTVPQKNIASIYQQQVGVPAVFPRSSFVALSQLSGDKGAKSILAQNNQSVAVDIPNAAFDIDTQLQLSELRKKIC
ncbi:nucleotidyltransferase family protein [Thalassotalea sp. PLHSN55]|uniref:nucleotidyltransferase family protein n=1 Tax=Thalassotalea sp. PLHSN55 TaxID=3435888 RepID=UPI003F8262B0